jgi:hypothetical protein
MDDPARVCRFERFSDLARDRQRLVERYGAARKPVLKRRTVDQLHHERAYSRLARTCRGEVLEAVDLRHVLVVSDASSCASRSKRTSRSRSAANRSGNALIATSRLSFVSRAQ